MIRVKLDEKGAKAIQKALGEMKQNLRGPAMLKALNRGSAVLAREARTQAARDVPKSRTIAKSIENRKGKYSKPYRPYKVIQHKNKQLDTDRIYAGYRIKHQTNWSKIGHLVAGGAAAGTRIAGTSIRQKRTGRNRDKVFRGDGSPEWTRQTDTGTAFVVVGASGRPHPIKRIRHPGTGTKDYFGDTITAAGKEAQRKFMDDALDVITNTRERFIFKGYTNG